VPPPRSRGGKDRALSYPTADECPRCGTIPEARLQPDLLSRTEILERIRAVAERTFNCPRSAITEQTVAEDIDGWDSLSHTIFIMNVEDEFGTEFDLAKVFSFDNVGDMITALEAKVAS
jgi:acyl carrier protein